MALRATAFTRCCKYFTYSLGEPSNRSFEKTWVFVPTMSTPLSPYPKVFSTFFSSYFITFMGSSKANLVLKILFLFLLFFKIGRPPLAGTESKVFPKILCESSPYSCYSRDGVRAASSRRPVPRWSSEQPCWLLPSPSLTSTTSNASTKSTSPITGRSSICADRSHFLPTTVLEIFLLPSLSMSGKAVLL